MNRQTANRPARALLLLLGVLASLSGRPVRAVAAPDGNSVLILGESVTGGLGSNEATSALAHGFTPVVVSDADWLATTEAEFATYRALVLGDATCRFDRGSTSPWIDAAEANRAVWSPVVTGNIIVNGTDPVFHQLEGGSTMTDAGVAFAADVPGKTGLYLSLSCYYQDSAPGTSVPVLDEIGAFSVTGTGLHDDVHMVAVHPALSGMTDASLSNWSSSVHEAFDSFPDDFLPLAIANGFEHGAIGFPDGSSGPPYVLARGETLSPVSCGDGEVQLPEGCDDSNTANGDGCSAQCTIEEPPDQVCGDGALDIGEDCDDGANGDDGDGCTDSCLFNNDPDCSTAAASPATLWQPNHKTVRIGIVGVKDPDGDPLTIVPTGIYQDEDVSKVTGDGVATTSPDASLSPLRVRAEHGGSSKKAGNGRVYHIRFVAEDGVGGTCAGEALVCVPHDPGRVRFVAEAGVGGTITARALGWVPLDRGPVGFVGEDGIGGTIAAEALKWVPPDRRRATCIDEGALYNSLRP